MKKVLAFLLVVAICVSLSGVALACWQELTVTDRDGNPIDWIDFKLFPQDEYTSEVDTVWVNTLDYGKEELYAAAEAAYPGETVIELGGITMNGYDAEYDYIFDYFGPFAARVADARVQNGDEVAVFVMGEEEIVNEVKACRVREGRFSFRASAPAYCVYVILH